MNHTAPRLQDQVADLKHFPYLVRIKCLFTHLGFLCKFQNVECWNMKMFSILNDSRESGADK